MSWTYSVWGPALSYCATEILTDCDVGMLLVVVMIMSTVITMMRWAVLCVSCGHLQATYLVSQSAEHSDRLQRCRPSPLHVIARSIWQRLHGDV